MNMSVLNEEFNRISNNELRQSVMEFFRTKVPEYFWTVSSSMSEKYHSGFDSGEGGLVRHTKMCLLVAEELIELEEFQNTIKPDIVYAAILIHDTFKYGNNGNHYRADHPKLAADVWCEFAEFIGLNKNIVMGVTYAVAWHSGQWSGPSTTNNFAKPKVFINEIKCVHLSDYIASRRFFDKVHTL